MYKAKSNLLIILYFYHATGKYREISMYKAGTNLPIILYLYHGKFQAQAGPKPFVFF